MYYSDILVSVVFIIVSFISTGLVSFSSGAVKVLTWKQFVIVVTVTCAHALSMRSMALNTIV